MLKRFKFSSAVHIPSWRLSVFLSLLYSYTQQLNCTILSVPLPSCRPAPPRSTVQIGPPRAIAPSVALVRSCSIRRPAVAPSPSAGRIPAACQRLSALLLACSHLSIRTHPWSFPLRRAPPSPPFFPRNTQLPVSSVALFLPNSAFPSLFSIPSLASARSFPEPLGSRVFVNPSSPFSVLHLYKPFFFFDNFVLSHRINILLIRICKLHCRLVEPGRPPSCAHLSGARSQFRERAFLPTISINIYMYTHTHIHTYIHTYIHYIYIYTYITQYPLLLSIFFVFCDVFSHSTCCWRVRDLSPIFRSLSRIWSPRTNCTAAPPGRSSSKPIVKASRSNRVSVSQAYALARLDLVSSL